MITAINLRRLLRLPLLLLLHLLPLLLLLLPLLLLLLLLPLPLFEKLGQHPNQWEKQVELRQTQQQEGQHAN